MNKEIGTIWQIPPHTEAKHEILRYYLGAWFPILASIHLRLLYVDGFAGPGEYLKRGLDSSIRRVDGSPIIALKVARDHTLRNKLQRPNMELVFIFIEKDERRCQNLKQKIAGLQLPSNFRIETRCASFEEVFDSALAQIEEQNKQLAPSFVFIDPFGPSGFPMSLVRRLAQQPRSEVLITFNYQALNQWFLQDPRKYDHVDELYGSDVWRPAQQMRDPIQKESYLMEAYQRALADLGWKGRFFRMINKHNQTQYYLFFATTHWEGMLAMKRAMWSAAPTGDFQYFDLTDPQQPRLITKEFYDKVYSQELAKQLYENRRGQTITKRTLVQNDVAWHPVCTERHLTRALKILESESTPPRIIEVDLLDARKRRKGTYPDDCTITFAP